MYVLQSHQFVLSSVIYLYTLCLSFYHASVEMCLFIFLSEICLIDSDQSLEQNCMLDEEELSKAPNGCYFVLIVSVKSCSQMKLVSCDCL